MFLAFSIGGSWACKITLHASNPLACCPARHKLVIDTMRLRHSLLLSSASQVSSFSNTPFNPPCATGILRCPSRSSSFYHDTRSCDLRSRAFRRRRHPTKYLQIFSDKSETVEVEASIVAKTSGDSTWASSAVEQQTDEAIREVITPALSGSSLFPLVLLNTVTILWGTQHAVIKLILQSDLSPGITNLTRFGLAALLFSPWTPGLLKNPPPIPFTPNDTNPSREEDGGAAFRNAGARETWQAGAELGLWMFLGFSFQAIGLQFTTASRSAFLLYLNVKLVPFFAYLLEGREISIPTWISAFLAFFGTVLLSSDGTPPNVGDLWSVLAACTSAMFILRLETYSGRCQASQLNSANLWVTAGLCGLWAAWEVVAQGRDPTTAVEGIRTQGPWIAYLAVVTTALTNWMQALGQRSVPAERAAVIYAMDPVYAAGFAYLLLGETLGISGGIGAAIITGAALWSQGQQSMEDGAKKMEQSLGNVDGE